MFSLLMLASAGRLAAQCTTQAPCLVLPTGQLKFTHQIGTALPGAQTLRMFSAPANMTFTVTSNAAWLLVNGATTTTGTTNTPTQDVIVTVNPASFTTDSTQTGTITFVSGSTSVPVTATLTVSTTPQVRVEPNSIIVSMEANSTRTIDVVVSSTTTTTPLNFITAPVAQTPATNWLSISPASGSTALNRATVTINSALLPAGTGLAVGAVQVQTFATAAGAVTIPVVVTTLPAAQIVVSPTTISFPYQRNFSLPVPRPISVTSSGSSQLLYTATVQPATQPFVSLMATTTAPAPGTAGLQSVQGTTGTPVYVIPNVAGLPVGTYEQKIRFESTGSPAQEVTARLVVSDSPQLTVIQDPQPFVYTLGGVLPTAQTIGVGATNGTLSFTATPKYDANTGGEWFRVSPSVGTTPTSLTITVDQTRLGQLVAGTYSGAITLTSGNSSLDIPVTLTVSGSALITVQAGTLPIRVDAVQGGVVQERTFTVLSTDGSNQPFTLTVEGTPAPNWLVLQSQSGATGATGTVVRFFVNPQAVTTPGTYDATIVVTPTSITNAPSFRIPVQLVLTGTTQLTPNPAQLTLTQIGSAPPAAQTIQITSTTPVTGLTATASQPWIQVTASSASTPATLTVTLNTASLTPGSYEGTITVLASGVQQLQIPVKLTVSSAATLTVTPASLNFAYTQNGATPAAQTLQLSSSGAAINFSAAATTATGGSWLSVEPTSGATGATGTAATALTVRVNPTGLTPGTYQGSVRITSNNASNATTTVNVTLTVSAAAIPTGISVVSSASNVAGAVSPGQLITLYGRNMAPSTQTFARVVNNVVQAQLGEVRVTFDGIDAPLLYVGPGGGGDQINAIVPYAVAGRFSTRMIVEYRNQRSDAIELRVADTNPGIFTQNQSGTGLGAILNQDNTVNGTNNAAQRGTIIQVYATGEGPVTPAGADGRVIQTQADLRQPLSQVSARINGVAAEVVYAGSAPTLVSGAFQVNIRIPANLQITAPTQVPIEIQVGQNITQRGVTVAVRP